MIILFDQIMFRATHYLLLSRSYQFRSMNEAILFSKNLARIKMTPNTLTGWSLLSDHLKGDESQLEVEKEELGKASHGNGPKGGVVDGVLAARVQGADQLLHLK